MRRLVTLLMVVGLLLGTSSSALAADPDPGTAKSNIYVQNIGQDPATVNLKFYEGEVGGLLGEYLFPEQIDVLGSKILPSWAFPDDVYGGWQGPVEVESTEPLATVSLIQWQNGAINRAGIYKGVDAPQLESYLPLMAYRPDKQVSRLSVQNTEDTLATVTIRWYDRDGNEDAGKAINTTIEPKTEKTFDLGQVQPNFSNTLGLGSAYVQSDKQIATVATVHWGAQQNYASDSYSGLSSGDTVLWAPGAWRNYNTACGNPLSLSCYKQYSTPMVQNLGTGPAGVTLEFYKDDGTLSHVMTDTIAPKASKAYNLAINVWGAEGQAKFDALVADLGNQWRGTVKITSDSELIAGTVTYFCPNSGTLDNLIYNLIPDTEPLGNRLVVPFVFRWREGLSSDRYSTTLVQNLSSSGGNVTVTFYDSLAAQMVPGSWDVWIDGNGTVGLNLRGVPIVDLPQSAIDALGTHFSGTMILEPAAGMQLRAVNYMFWDGSGQAASYTCYGIP